MGDNALDLARRAQLIDRANATNVDAINELTASIDDLRAQRKEVDSERASQAKAVKSVAAERESLDANLESLEAKASREDQATIAARNRRALSLAAATAAPTAPVAHTVSIDAPPPAPAGNPAPSSGGSSSHHNDPFLVCTRARESGGNYGIASADGLYYGAYQFLPSTWDVTANHAGRGDLVGVLPNRASVSDQDEVAWTLYQWQGKGPWGGRC
jgi:Transglycosylase-like domain